MTASRSEEFVHLINQCRDTCLWFMSTKEMPSGRKAQFLALDCIERYGSRDDFVRARRLRQWLLQHSNEAFVVS